MIVREMLASNEGFCDLNAAASPAAVALEIDAALFEVANWVVRDAFERADLVGAAG